MSWLELLVVLAAILTGARLGGIGLGVMGGLGLAVLTFGFGLQPTAPPVDVLLMIVAVITAAACLQAAGGMDYLVQLAERALRRHPGRITFVAPIVTYLFTLFAGTGHVAYSVMPVIAEVARESGVRPERPMSIAVIASQQAITASPISAATVALLALLSGQHVELIDILKVAIPATFLGCMIGALVASRMGVELDQDPVYRARLAAGEIAPVVRREAVSIPTSAKLAVLLFLAGAASVVLLGSLPALRPSWVDAAGKTVTLAMPQAIEMIMLSVAALILLVGRVRVETVVKNSVFQAGAAAVIGIFGIAWMGDTFIHANMAAFQANIQDQVSQAPWLFAGALFVMSILLYSQAATVRALVPLGIGLGIPPAVLIAIFPAVNGYFFIPNYPTIVAGIGFDTTGTTRIGRWLLNHSFMLPGLVATGSAIAIGFGLVALG